MIARGGTPSTAVRRAIARSAMAEVMALGAAVLIAGVLVVAPAWSSEGEDGVAVDRSAPLLVEPTRAAPPASASTSSAQPASAPAANAIDAASVDADPAGTLSRAHDAYAGGDFAAAAAGYRALLDAGHDRPLLHYDLGNAYLRHGELGRAIASYRRAAAGAPRDQDVVANLAYARGKARDAVAPPEPAAVWRTVFAWHYSLSRGELWAVAITLDFLLFTLLAVRLIRRHEALTWAAAVVGLLLAAAITSLAMHELDPTRVAVVLPREIEARAGNQKESVVRFKLHAGSEVLVRDQSEGWLRIALPSGEQGWIEASQAEVVEL